MSNPLFNVTPVLGFADVVLDFENSGAGSFPDVPYGGTYNETTFVGSFPRQVTLDVVLGDERFSDGTVDFLSLPTGSFVTVGFLDEVIVDGDGDDIFITEIAGNGELADIFVRAGKGAFIPLGQAAGGETASFDLADINFTGFVSEIKIVGLNNAGGSPGYDVVNVRALSAGLEDLDGPNRLQGSTRNDVIDLGKGRDVFKGGKGNDTVSGGGARDKLFGQKGKDTLAGNGGNDLLVGGGGADKFVFARNDGTDKIRDFGIGNDVIMILKGAGSFDQLTLEQIGTDALVSFAKTAILLEDTDVGDLTRDMFDFG